MAGRNKREKSRSNSPVHIFIEQNPASYPRGGSKIVSSHARRFQSAGKRRRQEALAYRGAEYARSLVGWNSSSSTATPSTEASAPSTRERTLLSTTPPPRRASASPLVRRGTPSQEREQENKKPSTAQMTVSVRSGLRIDPFDAFPTSNSRLVMLTVDFHIHVWGPYISGFFDTCMGYNTYLDLCWPIAMQDEMLFDATIAASRSALLVTHGNYAGDDSFMLYHRGLALSKLQERVKFNTPHAQVEVIFTIGRMLNIAYMTNEPEAFNLHFEAYQKLVEQYIAANPGTDISRINENRLRCWKAVNYYRNERDLLRDHSIQGSPSQPPSRETSRQSTPSLSDTLKEKDTFRPSPPFSELALSPGAIYLMRILEGLLEQPQSSVDLQNAGLVGKFGSLSDQLSQLLTLEDLSPLEVQLCCALVAFCLQLRRLHANLDRGSSGEDSSLQACRTSDFITPPNVPSLCDLAQTFINKKLSGLFESPQHTICITWSALMLGSYLLQHIDGYVRRKGHIILISLDVALRTGRVQRATQVETGWDVIEGLLKDNIGPFWHEGIAAHWERDWVMTMARQYRWEQTGLWKIGAPKTLTADGRPGGNEKVDIVEHLVMMDARDTLPFVKLSS